MTRAPPAKLVRRLLRSNEPSVRWRTRVLVLGEERGSREVRRLEDSIKRSPRVRALLSRRDSSFSEGTNRSIYHYWQGIHWALVSLVELGYPIGDDLLQPLVDRAVDLWRSDRYHRVRRIRSRVEGPRGPGVPVIRGRARRCASQQGNCLRYLTELSGGSDVRAAELARLLERWQWPDGGWNCDRTPEAANSSFMETLTPMRGLAAFARSTGDRRARAAAERAAEVFLSRRLFRRRSSGAVIRPDFLKLHYPLYWHYDVLGGLKGLAEVGRLGDSRCAEALDWLEGRQLPKGGWPADARYYRVDRAFRWNAEFVDWGAPGRTLNEWVTTDALAVLNGAGRLEGRAFKA